MHRKRRHRLATRIGAGIAAMLLPLAIAVAGGEVALHTLARRFDHTSNQALTDVVPIGDVRAQIGPTVSTGFQAMIGLKRRADFETAAAALTSRIDHLIAGARIEEEHTDLVGPVTRGPRTSPASGSCWPPGGTRHRRRRPTCSPG